MPYPPCLREETGNKVGWRYYATRADAELCATAAKHNASIQRNLGYDFGYCVPGEIQQAASDGAFIVCIP